MNPPADLLPALPDTRAELEQAEGKLLQGGQVVRFLKHHFAPGIYVREIWMPAGAIILGHEHTGDHLNVVVSGEFLLRAEGQVRRIVAGPIPVTFRSAAGVRKALYIIEDTTYMTVHVNEDDCHDIPTLEGRLIHKSATFKQHEIEMAKADFDRARHNLPN